ncbi:defensin beta 118-like [Chionomys nivalis]|uniref:defensin beta 118-like n=1 Tax=Chionomys nivalis TaxID=269649 RepID=UPI002599F35C|nr:defensin beta 118-like [Chionomys nivalis]
MKYLLLTLMVFFILFQLFPVCRCRKACWVIRGHCRKYCRSGEQVKKPCINGDYRCTSSKVESLPQPPQRRKFNTVFKTKSNTNPASTSTALW